ncbi:hypothetical protein GQ600_23169 [Phytophthora cactorum]|nr:hypothetical protein GQ600_23169 [Phytophthora cactorum]
MLELLLVYECFSEQATRLTTKALLEWCETKGLDYWALCRVTELVDEVYWQMLEQLQINPVSKTSAYEDLYQTMKRSTLDTDRTELVEAAIRLKRCIYEGYKCNTLVWNETTNTFNSLDGLAISYHQSIAVPSTGSIIHAKRPRVLICKEVFSQLDRRTGKLIHEARVVSIMDGYVHPDLLFMRL